MMSLARDISGKESLVYIISFMVRCVIIESYTKVFVLNINIILVCVK